MITGPGNVYVAAAKRVLRGVVGIDGENGPTEIAIIADATADPAYVAADLIAQAEHDQLAACLLVTTDAEPGRRGRRGADRQVAADPAPRAGPAALAGQSACVLVDDIDAALAVVDAWAPEHLEIQTRDAAKLAARVTQRRARSSPARTRRSRSGTTWPGPTTCCRPAAPRGTPAACRSSRSCGWST